MGGFATRVERAGDVLVRPLLVGSEVVDAEVVGADGAGGAGGADEAVGESRCAGEELAAVAMVGSAGAAQAVSTSAALEATAATGCRHARRPPIRTARAYGSS